MSMKISVSVHCDREGCTTGHSGSPTEKARAIRASAKSYGWKLGKKFDLCPRHAKELTEAVRAIQQSGNLP